MSIIIGRINENTSVRQRPHFCCFRHSLRYVICPQENSKSSSRLAWDYDIGCSSPKTIILINRLKLSFCDVMSSKIQITVFIPDRIFAVPLMSCTITISKMENTIVPELILRIIWEDTFTLSPYIRVICSSARSNRTSF